MEEIIARIIEDIDTNNEVYSKKIKELNNNNLSDVFENAKRVVNVYENDKTINIEYLSTIIEHLDSERVLSLERYTQIISMLSNIKQINKNGTYNSDIEQLEKILENLFIEIKKMSSKLLKNIQNYGHQKREYTSMLLNNKKIKYILNEIEAKRIISQENYNSISKYILESKLLTDEEKKLFISSLTKQNVSLMSNMIKMKRLKEKRKKELEEKKKIEKQKEKIEKERQKEKIKQEKQKIKEKTIEEKEDESKQIDKLKQSLTEEQFELYMEAKRIISTVTLTDEEIKKIASQLININTSIEDRKELYETQSELSSRKELIVQDISINILSNIEKNLHNIKTRTELFDLLKKLLSEYETIIEKEIIEEEEKKFDYITVLKELGLIKESELCRKTDELIEKCFSDGKENKPLKDTCGQFIEVLHQAKEEFIESIKEYVEDPKQNGIDVIEMFYEEMLDKYTQLKKIYDSFIYLEPNRQQQLLDNASEFYSEIHKKRNIIVFVNDDENIIPIIENDIENDKSLSEKYFGQTLDKLRLMVEDDFIARQGQSKDDKAKDSKYSEDFLKEFGVRSTHNGHSRIFYSRFNTTLDKMSSDYDKNTHLLFIFEVGYGNTDGNKKTTINYEALRRCYKDRKNIRKIIELFNTDWDSIKDPNKKAAIERTINQYLTRQNLKLGHFINKVKEQQLERGRDDR